MKFVDDRFETRQVVGFREGSRGEDIPELTSS